MYILGSSNLIDWWENTVYINMYLISVLTIFSHSFISEMHSGDLILFQFLPSFHILLQVRCIQETLSYFNSYHLFTFFYQWDASRRCNADMMIMMDLGALQNALNLARTYFVHCDFIMFICLCICLLACSARVERGQMMMMNCLCSHAHLHIAPLFKFCSAVFSRFANWKTGKSYTPRMRCISHSGTSLGALHGSANNEP